MVFFGNCFSRHGKDGLRQSKKAEQSGNYHIYKLIILVYYPEFGIRN